MMADEWIDATWGDLAVLDYGKVLRGYEATGDGFRVFGTNGPIGWHSDAAFPPGVVVGRKGAYRGIHYSPEPCWVIDTAFYLRIRDQAVLDPKFSYYQLKTVDLDAIDSGSAIPSTSRPAFYSIPVRLPPVSVQRRIARILSAFDELIENNTRRIEILEEMAQAIYREWFVNFRYPGHEEVPLVDSELGPIPEGWSASALTEAVEINPKVTITADTSIPFVPMTSVSESSMHISPIEFRAQASGAKFLNQDTLLARITPCLENGKTAFVQCLGDGESGCGSTELITLRSRKLCPEYVYLLARTDEFRAVAIQSMSGATGRQRVRTEALAGFLLPLPPAPLIERFHALTRPMFSLSFELFEQVGVLRQTRDLLLPRLISGEVDVSGLDIGELVS